MNLLRPALVLFGGLTLLTGVIYPLTVTGVAQTLFANQANGSLIEKNGQPIGSELIGQGFENERYFWGRPSATGPEPYNAAASGGSNLGPLNPALHDAVKGRIEAMRVAHPDQNGPVPVDLVTTSASGLDPHLSPAAALYQSGRIARVRGLPLDTVKSLIERQTEARTFGVLGEPVVNVLKLNLALDALSQNGNRTP
ncbi:potassium-transporting ATPase subunit KdpC [Permianibacter sp. IMCC34836]|uniref:potassium-transporting ATPase subunit KdpC n=1 Tax=Permianibacter fluminis TaxID=2738515 RepID=UPI0015576549|nr:potassium-transporting ATPase subunit KdpC [Permianibacter fluminis]NQD37869.1 potassium-transporting ATPase subunit KdpC [Permianibacter fluminis]